MTSDLLAFTATAALSATTIPEIAERLDRTPHAIALRVRRLNLPERHPGGARVHGVPSHVD